MEIGIGEGTARRARLLPRGTRILGRALLILILILTALPALSLTPSVSAASFVVNSPNDPGDGTCDDTECTLREAIDLANSTEEADTITFDASVTSIMIDSGTLYIYEDLTIQGPGSGALTITIAQYGNGIEIDGEPVVNLTGFTLDFDADNYCCVSGIYVEDAGTLNLNDVVVQEFDYSGIYLEDEGVLTVTNSVVRNNDDYGIYRDCCSDVDAALTITGSRVEGNGYSGIYSYYGTVTITNSTVQDNGDSGIYLDESVTLTVTNSTVQNNGDSGIYDDCCDSYSNTMTITGTTIRGNDGAGIYRYDCGGQLIITGSVIEDNTYIGIDQDCGSLLTVRDTIVRGNGEAGNDGGGIESDGSALIVNSTIANNIGDWGAGLSLYGEIVTINSTTITGNIASNGGGGFYNETDLTQIYNSTISNNSAAQGGGIYNDDDNGGTLQIVNSTISLNTVTTVGGGLLTEQYSDVTLRFVTIAGNSAGLDGGGIFAYPSSDALQEGFNVELLGSIVAGNVDNETTGQTKNDCFGTSFVSLGYNLLGIGSDCPTGGTGDVAFSGAITSVLNTTLADNGGPTPTHALTPNSPANGKVPAELCVSSNGANGRDQRGFVRSAGSNCDIGAFEANPQASCVSPFTDVANASIACPAIVALSQEGVILGYGGNRFGPTDPVQRAQMAAFIVRALDWENRPTGPTTFSDFGTLVTELRTASLILANACEAQTGCVARGYGDGRFGPNDQVSYAQVISFITRAFQVNEATNWQPQPNAALPYTGVPGVHATDIRTYTFYAGAIPDAPTSEIAWNAPAPREWVAQVLYFALQTAP